MLARLRGHILYDLDAPDDRLTSVGLRLNDMLYPLAGATDCPFPIRQEGLHAFARWLTDQQITRISAVASGFRQLLGILQPGQSFPHVRSIRITSEPTLGADIAAAGLFFPNSIMLHTFSLSEGGWVANYYVDPHAQPEDSALPVGYIVDDKEVWLVDEAGTKLPSGNRASPGDTGEIVLCGADLADGYWNQPELTQQKFQDDPRGSGRRIYATGDLGRFLPDGSLLHLGRMDLQVKIRGYRVEIGETETALRALPSVKDIAVRAWEDAYGEHYLAAYVVPAVPEVTASSLRSALSGQLPDYMAPKTYVMLEKLPQLYNGKVDRRALPQPERVRPNLTTPYAPPATPLETRLADIWAEVLDLDLVGVADRFTDLGGHSLAAVRLLAALDELTGRELPFSVLLEAGTVRELAAELENDGWTPAWRSLVQVQAGDGRLPLYLVPAAASTSLGLAPLAAALGPEQGVYGFDPLGLDGRSAPHDSVEEMAAHYIREMRLLQPEGPYLLGGRCFGAHVALEMAVQLQEAGESVPLLAVLDAAPPQAGPSWSSEDRLLSYPSNRWMYLHYRLREKGAGRVVRHAVRRRYVKAQRRWQELAAGEFEVVLLPESVHSEALRTDASLRVIAQHLRNELGRVNGWDSSLRQSPET